MTVTGSALVLSWVAILALAFVAAGLFERVTALEQQVGPTGATPKAGSRRLPTGATFQPDGRPLVLVVASPTCTGCARLLPQLGRVIEEGLDLRLLWVREEGPSAPAEIEQAVITDREAGLLGATATPYALVVDADGEIAWSGAVADIDRLLDLTRPVRTDKEDTPQ